jgi:biofilm PGA synthesis N-glycosyltransferase PgaC
MNGRGISVIDFLIDFSYYYPLFMAYLWITGATFYYWRFERSKKEQSLGPPLLAEHPLVCIVVPCHNEGTHIYETVEYLLACNYPNFEILLANDGSADETRDVLELLAARNPKVRVIHLAKNQGKAVALTTAALMTSAEYLACIDADALLDPDAVTWMMSHMLASPRVAAVTGNPRVRNRSTLLGRLQLGEYSSIVGLIKRAQRTYGRVFTVSGVVACFRKSALHDVGYWSPDILTEDIDVSWRLQLRHWDVRFEPQALCWVLTPETVGGLWKQRVRWAMGGMQVLMKHLRIQHIFVWKSRRMWPVLVEYILSVAWAYAMLLVAVLWFIGMFVELPEQLRVPTLFSGWNGVLLGTTCLIQIGVSLKLDARYDSGGPRHFFWMIWYPLAGLLDTEHGRYGHRDAAGAAAECEKESKMDESGPRHSTLKPPIIDRADLQTLGQRSVSGVLTTVFWLLWAYLWLPLLALIAWALGLEQAYKYMIVEGGYWEVLRLLGIYTVVILLMGGSLVGWATYNILRYGKRGTRSGNPGQPIEEVARYFRQGPLAVAAWRQSQRIYVHHDEKGGIAGVEMLAEGEPVPKERQAAEPNSSDKA